MLFIKCYIVMRVVSSLYVWQSFLVVVVADACPVPVLSSRASFRYGTLASEEKASEK